MVVHHCRQAAKYTTRIFENCTQMAMNIASVALSRYIFYSRIHLRDIACLGHNRRRWASLHNKSPTNLLLLCNIFCCFYLQSICICLWCTDVAHHMGRRALCRSTPRICSTGTHRLHTALANHMARGGATLRTNNSSICNIFSRNIWTSPN